MEADSEDGVVKWVDSMTWGDFSWDTFKVLIEWGGEQTWAHYSQLADTFDEDEDNFVE